MTKPPSQPMTPLEERIATTMCQCNRVIRSMPSADEIARMLPLARSVIKQVRKESP